MLALVVPAGLAVRRIAELMSAITIQRAWALMNDAAGVWRFLRLREINGHRKMNGHGA